MISYLPLPLKRLLLSWSFFDLLSELFIIKSTMKFVSSLMSPFMDCDTKEKAKQQLDKLRQKKLIS
jgi:hypothetical protein